MKVLKPIRWISLNIIIGAICAHSISEGGDPTFIGSLGIIGLTLVNGIEWTDWLAAKQALDEMNSEE